jgi:tetratricopeptide (TPR) repeat protein
VRYEKARLLEKENSFASAAKEMKEAVMLDPMLVSGHLWLAQVYHRDKILDEAEHYYRLALMARRDAFPALMGLAEILLEKNDGLEAASLLARASLLKPELFEIRIKLAHVYEKLTGEPEKALQALKELQAAIANGRIKGKVGIDLNSKINDLEKLLRPVPKEQAQELQPGRIPAHSKKGG